MTIITIADFDTGTIHRVEVPYTFEEMEAIFTRPEPEPAVYIQPDIIALPAPLPHTPAYLRRKPRKAKLNDDNGDDPYGLYTKHNDRDTIIFGIIVLIMAGLGCWCVTGGLDWLIEVFR